MPPRKSSAKPAAKAAAKATSTPVAKASATPKPDTTTAAATTGEKRRFWLNYPPRQITRPIIWELSRKFDIVFNIRQASVSDEIGILCLELEGARANLKSAIAWLESEGVKVEPVEIGVIES
jgi:ABC-type methionine transport system ATPase subunit